MRLRRSLVTVMVAALFASQVAAVAATTVPPSLSGGSPTAAPIDKTLAKDLAAGRARTIIVEFSAKADLRPAKTVKDHAKRGQAVLDALTVTAGTSQRGAKAVASASKGVHATTYWLTNVMVVTGDPATLAKVASKLAREAGVASIRSERIYPLIAPVDPQVAVLAAAGDPEWGVAKIGADAAWEKGILGQGVVVANVDTGVDYTHPALIGNYRGNNHDGTFTHDYNWWDPAGVCPDPEPCDNAAHGTHTMGTMVGGDGPGSFTPDIGVAPGAQWIAAKGCEDLNCTESSLLSAGQFILAPTDLDGENPNPALRPDVVNNSWGSGPNDPFYQETVNAWRAAGIIPVFSSGNPGPGCGDGGSPGDYLESFSAGATDSDDLIADFSGRGPSVFGKINPDISAPGVDVVSSVPGGGYEAFSGTSMAAPHTSGTIALVLSAKQALLGDIANFGPVTDAIRSTAVDRIDLACGGDDDGDPNNTYGDGRIDAAAATALVATGGTLSGTISETGTSTPIGGAKVTADNGTRTFTTSSDASGDYELFLAAGTYEVSVAAFGYFGSVAPGLEVATDQTTDHDVGLALLPKFTVSGTITSAENGAPIPDVAVRAVGVPVAPTSTDSVGNYSLLLPIGTYTLRASADGCTETGSAEIVSSGDDVDQDFSLFRKLDDFGHVCAPIPFEWVDASSQTALFGDEIAGRLRLPFTFDFYGTGYDAVFVADNGYLNFLQADIGFFNPTAIPTGSAPNGAIYPFWQDLVITEVGGVDSATIGDAPNRAFVVEFSQVKVLGSTSLLDFEVKLWENGAIDFVYGSNLPNPGDGRLATIGIENQTGTDALQIGFFEQNLDANTAIRITTVPTGFVDGTITDANDDLPIVGARVTAQPSGRHATTGEDGTYHLRLLAGTYDLTASATDYSDASANDVVIVDDVTTTRDFSLGAPTAGIVPTSVSAEVQFGTTAARQLTLSNDGSATLDWIALEKNDGVTLPPLPEPTVTALRTPAWKRQALPKGFPLVKIADTSAVTLLTIINDPLGDATGPIDVGAVRAGSDGSSVMSMALDYSSTTPMDQTAGYVFLDTDQDPSTGVPPAELAGLPSQDVGVDFYLDLFLTHDPDPVVLVVDTNTFEVTAAVPVTFIGQTMAFDIPLEALGGDDGSMDTAMVLGDFFEPHDWAPDIGHGTIEPFTDASWLTVTPTEGQVPADGQQVIDLVLGGATLQPGEYHASLVFVTNAPRTHQIQVDLTLVVLLPDDFGAVSGTVTDAHTGEPLPGASVTVHAQFPPGTPFDFAVTTDGGGAYSVVGPAGTWPADYATDGYVPVTRDVTIAAGVTTPGADASLHRIQPHASLEGDLAPTFILLQGHQAQAAVTLGNPDGHADLTFEVFERPVNATIAGEGSGADPTATGIRSSKAPAGHTARTVRTSISGDPTLVLMDTLPWDSDAIQQVLDANGIAFDEAGSADIPSLDLSPYHAIYVGNDQSQAFYDVWFANQDKFVAFVEGGGFLWFGASAFGFENGDLDGAVLPGGLTVHGPAYEDDNTVEAPDHPLMAGVPNPFHGSSASHVTFGDLPGGATVIAGGVASGEPTLVDYDLGAGHVVAVGQPVEFGFAVGEDTALILENGVPFGEAFIGFADVPWVSVAPVAGSVAVDGSTPIVITVDSSGLEPGVYRASVVIKTNDPDHGVFQVPVTLVVPSFQQGINAGGGQYVAGDGTLYASDRKYDANAAALAVQRGLGRQGNQGDTFGWVGKSDTQKTNHAIAGTTDDRLFQDLREGATGYKFTVPEGTYQVQLDFAELKAKKALERVFGIALEGDEVLASLDVFKQAGGKERALVKTFIVTVDDGVLDIDFPMPKGHKSIVNGIVVTLLPPGSPGT